jgi:hypothetical protein
MANVALTATINGVSQVSMGGFTGKTTHLCRDYPTQFTLQFTSDIAQWLLAIFLERVLGYTIVGSTNFTANFTPLASGTASPNLAGINYGATGGSGGISAFFEVGVPSGVYVVSLADVQRVLVLKSVANPTFNSGCFLVQGVDIANNRFIVDYRTADPGSPVFPPPELGVSTGMQWFLYSNDSTTPATRGSNGGAGYHGNLTSTNSRIVFQSPGTWFGGFVWQVRLCSENSTDYGGTGSGPCNPNTAAPGFGGTGAGDFPTGANGGKHLHHPMFWDTLNNNQGADNTRAFAPGYNGGITGGAGVSNALHRITIIGDDGGQACAIFMRHLNSGASPQPSQCMFGVPNNESLPLPTDNTRRLFVLGYVNGGNNGNNVNIQWGSGRNDEPFLVGNGFGSMGLPITATTGLWTNIESNTQNASAIWSANAADNPFLTGTELTDVDVWLGTQQTWNTSFNYPYVLEPRLAGTFPFLRAGRTNFNNYQATTDASRSFYHFINGVFMRYNGPNPVP